MREQRSLAFLKKFFILALVTHAKKKEREEQKKKMHQRLSRDQY